MSQISVNEFSFPDICWSLVTISPTLIIGDHVRHLLVIKSIHSAALRKSQPSVLYFVHLAADFLGIWTSINLEATLGELLQKNSLQI